MGVLIWGRSWLARLASLETLRRNRRNIAVAVLAMFSSTIVAALSTAPMQARKVKLEVAINLPFAQAFAPRRLYSGEYEISKK